MGKKINILFDAYVLAEGDNKTSSRSGIFFTTLNILKEFSKNEKINVSIYCSNKKYSVKLKEILDKYFPNNYFNNLYLDILSPIEKLHSKLTCDYKEKKNPLTKIGILSTSAIKKSLPKKSVNLEKLTKDIDIYFSPVYKIPEDIKKIKSIRKYTLLHDLIPILYPEYFNKNKKYWFYEFVKQLNNNDYYFTNSQNTKEDFVEHFPQMDADKVTPVLLACSENFKPEKEKTKASLEKYNLPTDKKYIFSLCTLEPRKNLIRAVKCFIEFVNKNNINDMVYILGGGSWDGFIEKMEKEIPDFEKYKHLILRAGYIDDEDLAPLYSGAEWFVYTSEYEGFGLPPLEAMSCGCPVITSNNSSLPEVVGDCGIMIDYDSDEQHINAYETYYYNYNMRKENAEKGLKRAKEFSWKKCADLMIEEMAKEPVRVAFICDDKYAMPTAVAIQSIIENKKPATEIEINIIANEVSPDNLEKLRSMTGKNVSINIIETDNKYSSVGNPHEYVSKAALLKFDLPEIFKNYDKILYLDSDVLVLDDLSILYETSIEGKYAAVCKDFLAMQFYRDNIEIGLQNYFNSGVMLLNLAKMREDKTNKKLLMAKEHDRRKYMDQDAFNMVFKNDVVYLNPQYNYMKIPEYFYNKKAICTFYEIEKLSEPVISHLTYRKPWEFIGVPDEKLWIKYFKKSPFKIIKLKRKYKLIHKIKNSLYEKLVKFFFIKLKLMRKYKNLFYINKQLEDLKITQFLSNSDYEKRECVTNLIVSLTSFPQRMYDIKYTIFSLMNQTIKPEKIILWLGEDKFPNKEQDLPEDIRNFINKGLTIKWVEDLKSYTKLVYALNEYPNSIIVTADDDIYYPMTWLENLYESYKQNDKYIHCHRAHKIKFNNENKILPYNSWENCTDTSCSYFNFLTGVGGVLYPPKTLFTDTTNKELFKNISPDADDIWFWAMAVKNGTKIKVIENNIKSLIYVNPERELRLNNELNLHTTNVFENKNDTQLHSVLKHYPEIIQNLKEEINEEKPIYRK